MELFIAILALVISTLIGIWTLRHTREQARAARLANVTNIVSIERSLAEVPTALRFHGVSQQDLDDAGISAAELACLVASCSATSLYHNSTENIPANRSRRATTAATCANRRISAGPGRC